MGREGLEELAEKWEYELPSGLTRVEGQVLLRKWNDLEASWEEEEEKERREREEKEWAEEKERWEKEIEEGRREREERERKREEWRQQPAHEFQVENMAVSLEETRTLVTSAQAQRPEPEAQILVAQRSW